MLRCVTLCALALLISDTRAGEQAPPPESDMTPIFNGKDLSGWDGDPRLWSVRDGVIHGETTDDVKSNGNTFLIWKGGNTADFELRLSFRCSTTNNSGIQYRSQRIPADQARNQWVVRGYQHEIRNQVELPSVSGFIYDEGGLTGKRGRIILVGQKGVWKGDKLEVSDEVLITGDEFKELFRLDDWNDVVIRAKGRHIQHFMNGRLTMDFTDSEERALTDGVLALQLHGGKPMFAEYRDIRIKELK